MKIEMSHYGHEEVFNQYLNDFGLKEEDLKDKAILDVGSGMVPNFVEYCLEKGISRKVVAVDRWPFGHKKVDHYSDKGFKFEYSEYLPLKNAEHLRSKKHFIQAEGEHLPIKKDFTFDLVLMRAAVGQASDPVQLIREITSYLNRGGELRVAPVWRKSDPHFLEVIETLDRESFDVELKEDVVQRETKDKPLLVIVRKK